MRRRARSSTTSIGSSSRIRWSRWCFEALRRRLMSALAPPMPSALGAIAADAAAAAGVVVRPLGQTEYEATWRAMQAFTAARMQQTPDELWQTEHPPTYTLGLAGRRRHLLRDNGIPVVNAD